MRAKPQNEHTYTNTGWICLNSSAAFAAGIICENFATSEYVAKINSEKDRTGLSYSQIAEKYGIAPAALLGWVKSKYAPSRASFRKYIVGNPLFYESLYV